MIGVALVVFVAIFAAGLRATIDKGIDEQVRAAGIVTHEDGFSPLPAGVAKPIEQVDGVDRRVADALRDRPRRRRDGNTTVTGIDPATVGEVADARVERRLGRRALGPRHERRGRAQDFADKREAQGRRQLRLTTPRGNEVDYRVAGTYEPGAGVIGGVLVSNAVARARLGLQGRRVRARRRRRPRGAQEGRGQPR